MVSSLTALIIERRPTHRVQLKQALSVAGGVRSIRMTGSPAEALQLIKNGDTVDMICISDRFDKHLISSFISSMQEHYSGRDTVVILTVDATADGSTITSGLIEGISGFLVSPYSVEGLQDVMSLARRIRRHNMEERVQKALGFYIEGLRSQLNELANHKKKGRKAGVSTKVFSEMCSALKELDADLSARYLETLVDSFTKEIAKEEKAIARKAFSSASYRVRRNTASQAIKRLVKAVA